MAWNISIADWKRWLASWRMHLCTMAATSALTHGACCCTGCGVSWQMARMSCPSAVMSCQGVLPASAW